MGETKTPDTKIIFGSREDIEKRTLKIKEIYGPSKNAFLIGDEYEKCRNVIQLMTLEGMSTDFIYDLMAEEPGDEYAMTADFLHSAAMIMGEEYVREHLLGRTIQAEEACRQIREDYYEKQMEPLRKMYEDLDAKIQAALSGEEQARQQLAIFAESLSRRDPRHEGHVTVVQRGIELGPVVGHVLPPSGIALFFRGFEKRNAVRDGRGHERRLGQPPVEGPSPDVEQVGARLPAFVVLPPRTAFRATPAPLFRILDMGGIDRMDAYDGIL